MPSIPWHSHPVRWSLQLLATATLSSMVYTLDDTVLNACVMFVLLTFGSRWLLAGGGLVVGAALLHLSFYATYMPDLAWPVGLWVSVVVCSLAGRLSLLDDVGREDAPPFLKTCCAMWSLLAFSGALFFLLGSAFRTFDIPTSLFHAASLGMFGWKLRGRLPVDAKTLLFSGVVMLLCLIPLEYASRRLLPPPPDPGDLYMSHPESIYTHRPSTTTEVLYPSEADEGKSAIPVRINSQGFRGPDYDLPKPKETIRILCIGDSYTFGQGSIEADTYPAQLERLLIEALPNRRIEVINGGISGQGPWQARIALLERGFPLVPDVVVLQTFMGNDIGDTLIREGKTLDSYMRSWLEFVRAFEDEASPAYKLNRFLRVRCNLYLILEQHVLGEWALLKGYNDLRFVPEKRSEAILHPIKRAWANEPDLCDWYPNLEQGWQSLQQDILGILKDCRHRATPAYVFNIPWHIDSAKDQELLLPTVTECYELDKGNRLMESFVPEYARIPMLAAFREYPEPARLKFPNDGHLSKEGNALVARQVANGLLPWLKQFSGNTRGNAPENEDR